MSSLVCITGATGGLGKAFAVECASRGWDLFITDLSEAALTSLAAGLSGTYGIKVVYYPCDLSDHTSRTELFEYMHSMDLRFRSLINVAGLDYEGPFAERTREQIRTILRVDVEANLEMTYAVLKLADKEETFRLINVASLAAFYPMPLKALYSASKRFILNFTLAVGEELKSMGGTATALCPAGMPTNVECIRSIDSQGFLGRITTKNVGYVAAKTIDCSLKGHAVYIPGKINRVINFFGGIIPPAAVARLIRKRWDKTRSKVENTIAESAKYGY